MDKILEQVRQFEITDKTVIAISGDMSMERKANIREQIEVATGMRPPVIMTGDSELTAIEITPQTLLVVRDARKVFSEGFGLTMSQIRKAVKVLFPVVFLNNGQEITAIQGRGELTRLRDTINEILESKEVA